RPGGIWPGCTWKCGTYCLKAAVPDDFSPTDFLTMVARSTAWPKALRLQAARAPLRDSIHFQVHFQVARYPSKWAAAKSKHLSTPSSSRRHGYLIAVKRSANALNPDTGGQHFSGGTGLNVTPLLRENGGALERPAVPESGGVPL